MPRRIRRCHLARPGYRSDDPSESHTRVSGAVSFDRHTGQRGRRAVYLQPDSVDGHQGNRGRKGVSGREPRRRARSRAVGPVRTGPLRGTDLDGFGWPTRAKRRGKGLLVFGRGGSVRSGRPHRYSTRLRELRAFPRRVLGRCRFDRPTPDQPSGRGIAIYRE